MDLDRARDDILEATLSNIAFDGWTDQAVRTGTRLAGYPSGTERLAFPGGVGDVVAHFNDWADRRMTAALQGTDFATLRVPERIACAIRARLEALTDHREAVRHTLAWLALPPHLVQAGRLVYRTVDQIWHLAGDQATDTAFYTKRGTLAAILSATTLYWLDDRSEDGADTWAFLDRRLSDSAGAGRAASKLVRR